jgi:Cu2+-exporting ATPase
VSASAAGLCSQCRLALPSRAYREEAGGQALAFCCFGCLTVYRVVGASGESGRAGWFLAKLGLAGLLAGNVMMFQSLLYFGSLDALGRDVLATASGIMLALSLAVFLLLGVPMLATAFRAAKQGRIVLETLIGVGALTAIGASARETLRGGHRVYYDSGTMVLVLVVLGQYLDARARQKATEALQPAVARARRSARVSREHGEVVVAPQEVMPGERVRVRAGEEIPVDGVVLEGSSDVSEPALTGEPMPRLARPGDAVYAGTVAVDGALLLEASGRSQTLAERIARWTERARGERAPMEIAADRFVSRFIPAVVAVALASALGWGLGKGRWDQGGLAALAVLVVACPCALGIATPMATTIALTRAAARGTLIRSGAVLESLASVRQVAFDKTGTLTWGEPIVAGITPFGTESEGELLAIASAVETAVDHPLARAIVAEAERRGIAAPAALGVRAIAGGGAEGSVEGRPVLIGSATLLASRGIAADDAPNRAPAGSSRVVIAVDDRVRGEIFLRDAPRPEAREALASLRALGVRTVILSGDRKEAVGEVAREVGIEAAAAELAPGEKPQAVRRLRIEGGPIAMVGDGINDAPALATADVGIAFGPAADLAREASDAVILRADLREVGDLLRLARRTRRTVRANLAWAFGYNTVGVLLAALGYLRPVVAATAMVLSSLFVVGNSLRLRRGEGPRVADAAAPVASLSAARRPA